MQEIINQPLIESEREPLISSLFSSSLIDYEDYALAEKLCREGGEEASLFLIYLSMAAKNGHLCAVKNGSWLPSPKSLWQERFGVGEDEMPLKFAELEALIDEGVQKLPLRLFEAEGKKPPLIKVGNRYYFFRFWDGETRFAKHVERMESSPPTISFDPKHVEKALEEKPLLKEQKGAVMNSLSSSLSIISGGPGTGKTYTAGVFIQTFWELLPPEKRKECRIVLAAPTGKAAANLQGSLNRVLSTLDDFQPIKAETIHSLLYKKKEGLPLLADLVLIDESSMIDVALMAKLLESVNDGARLILLGDSHQLPPVEAGSLFRDLIALKKKKGSPIGELTSCMRTEMPAILEFATAVHQGDVEKGANYLKESAEGIDVHGLDSSLPLPKQQKAIVDHASRQYLEMMGEGYNHETIKAMCGRFCLLSPLRKGPFGVETLNRLIWDRLQGREKKIVPIIIKKNDKKKGLFNGDIGVLVTEGTFEERGAGDYALFPGHGEEGDRKIPALLLPPYAFAFCLSVHQSQGSEYQRVSLLIPESAAFFGRELLYTGITRAKKKLEIWGDEETVKKMIRKKTTRISGLYHN